MSTASRPILPTSMAENSGDRLHLEQGEHRGIAVFSKALIRCLHVLVLRCGCSPVSVRSERSRAAALPRKAQGLIQMSVLSTHSPMGVKHVKRAISNAFQVGPSHAGLNQLLLLKVWLSRPSLSLR